MTHASERGAVLVFVVLLMLALVGIGHGVLVAALAEAAASRAAVRHLVGRAAADAAVNLALRSPGGVWMDSVPIGGTRNFAAVSLGRAEGAGAVRRLAAETWLVEGEGRLPGRPATRAARLAWSPDPLARVLALEGALTVFPGAPVSLAGSLEVATPAVPEPPLTAADCAAWAADLEARYAVAPLAALATAIDTLGAPRLGLLDFEALAARAGPSDLVFGPAGTPEPIERFGTCALDEPWGWGDPESPWRPCGSYLPLRVAPAGLVVLGGAGQGTLVVDGDLTLTAGARYHGLVIVRGSMRIEDGSSLDGLAIASGGVELTADSRVRGSACWAVRALAAQRGALGRLITVPGVGEVGPL